MSTATAVRPSRPEFQDGLGLVTLICVALVTLEHYLVLIDRPVYYPAERLILGRIGVFAFLVMSGLHAAQSTRPPVDWLRRRLVRIYPSLWIVLSISFLTAWFTGLQSFDVWQVLAQMSGWGYFFYRDNLILEPTWFLSPLLACYLAVFLLRSVSRTAQWGMFALLVAATVAFYSADPWLAPCLLAFAVGYLAGQTRSPAAGLFAAGLGFSLWWLTDGAGLKLGLACVLVAGGVAYSRRLPGIRPLAARSYEFFLVHGLAFYGALRYLNLDPLFGGVVALAGSLLLTELLHQVVHVLPAI